MSDTGLIVEHGLVPHIERPTDLPENWFIVEWEVTMDRSFDWPFRDRLRLRIGLVYAPTGVHASFEWAHAQPPMDFGWVRSLLTAMQAVPPETRADATGSYR